MRGAYLLLVMVCGTTMAAPSTGADQAFAHYRGVTLGQSLETVVQQLKASSADIRTVQERPTPVRELAWRPAHRFGRAAAANPEARSEMLLTFHRDRLARIAVTYDRDQTRGLTDTDLREALTGTYGIAMLASPPVDGTMASADATDTIGRWGDAETLVRLWRQPHPEQVKLTITAIAADRAMQVALADGARLEATEAPTRDVARRVVEAATVQAGDRSARTGNKAAFKP